MSDTPDLGALLAEAIAFARGSIATAIPATVLAYDHVLQRCTAKPTVSGRYQDPDTGILIPFPLPTVANVPVAFPSATGFAITWPLAPGDTVFLVLSDRSMDEWKAGGASENVPLDIRRFDLTDSVAIPGLRPFSRPIPPTGVSPVAMVLEGVDIRLGSSAAAMKVALAPLLAAFLGDLKGWLDTHTHPAPGGATSPPAGIGSPSAGNLGATKVSAE